jgi:SpoVK/Ycf46/Vps4 family AAA+-type ATPase
MDTEINGHYSISSIIDIIEVSKNYETGRKRKRVEYNFDLERLKPCIKALKKLNELVGMEEIKKNIIDQILFYAQGLNTNEMMHVCLTGPPGVGKTTVGKILAELYCSLGFLETDKFRIADRSSCIGGYLGQTAIKTKKVLKESLGGVLFLDEVYSFGSGKDDGDSYAKECIDTINQFLSEHTENFIMIIAGYNDEVEKCFFSVNPGLRRRFPWRYDIKDYTHTDLKEIFIYQVKENYWNFEQDFDFGMLTDIFQQKEYFKDNGGSCLVLFDKAKICHSRRVFGKRKRFKKYLNISDITKAFELIKRQHELSKKDTKPPFGMYL